jgi:phage terminase Nu1 subunit (DNA packaging protein)
METSLLAKYPLPPGVDDAEMNRGQLAQAFDVSTNTIDKWRSDGMPVVQEGTNGKSYVFRLSECWAWREAGLEDERSSKASGEASVQQMRMHFLGLEDNTPRASMTPAQIIAMADAEMRWTKAARDRRELVHVSEVEAALEDVFGQFRAALQSLPDWAERELGLNPAQVIQMIGQCDAVLAGVAGQIEAAHLQVEDQPELSRAQR